MSTALREFLDFATETAYLAGRLTLGYFQSEIQPEIKSDGSPVTIADRKSEELIRERIGRCYPQHAILGEEYGSQGSSNASHRWLIDPIDGTKSFVHGVPLYAVLLGLEIAGQVQVGAVYFPALDEMISAADGEGCWWNNRRAQVSPVSELHKAVVTHTDLGSFWKNNRRQVWERLVQTAYYRAGWSDAYGYALVATGRAEVALDPIMSVWDCGPFPPIFREAGGYFGDWQGRETIYAGEAMATSQVLLPQVLKLLGEADTGAQAR